MQAAPAVPDPSSPGAASGAGGAASAKGLTLAIWAKIGMVSIGVCGAAGLTYHVATSRAAAPIAVPVRASTAEAASVAPPAAVPAAAGTQGEVAIPSGGRQQPVVAQVTPRESRARPPRPSREAVREVNAIAPDHSLGLETQALDQAREALDARHPAEALRLLDEHARAFPQGRLRPEATVLRLAALVQAGNQAGAKSLAARLLADDSYKAYASRIRSLLRDAER